MIVVADASPLIFLSKLNLLDLIARLHGTVIHVSSLVEKETVILSDKQEEQVSLRAFLAKCRIHAAAINRSFSNALSRADNATLDLAIHLKADLILADDRILRSIAEAQGIRPMGTLGMLLTAKKLGILSVAETRRMLDALVVLHGFRIAIPIYQAALRDIDAPL